MLLQGCMSVLHILHVCVVTADHQCHWWKQMHIHIIQKGKVLSRTVLLIFHVLYTYVVILAYQRIKGCSLKILYLLHHYYCTEVLLLQSSQMEGWFYVVCGLCLNFLLYAPSLLCFGLCGFLSQHDNLKSCGRWNFLKGWDMTSNSWLDSDGVRITVQIREFFKELLYFPSMGNAEFYLRQALRVWRRFAVARCLYSS